MNKRISAVVIAGGLVASAVFAGPATAAKKKKPKPKPPAPAVCQPYTPGEAGKDKPLVAVTDAATEAAPVEQKVTLGRSLGDARVISQIPREAILAETYDHFNVQVDTANPDAGLYVLFEFPERRDYDLEVLYPDDSYAARSHDWNTVLGTGRGANGGHAGEATTKSEKIVGIRTPDCGGYTVEAVNWLGEGGDFTIKMWLGDVKHDPLAPGEEARG
jgi:hypothetical protein